MGGASEWSCEACTFRHMAPAPRCAMCGELRVTRERMREFVTGGKRTTGGGAGTERDGPTAVGNSSGGGGGGGDGSDRSGVEAGDAGGRGGRGAESLSSSMALAPAGPTLNAPPSAAPRQQQRPAMVANPYARKRSAPGGVGTGTGVSSGGGGTSSATDGQTQGPGQAVQPNGGAGPQQQCQQQRQQPPSYNLPQQQQQQQPHQQAGNPYRSNGNIQRPAHQPQQQSYDSRQDRRQEYQAAPAGPPDAGQQQSALQRQDDVPGGRQNPYRRGGYQPQQPQRQMQPPQERRQQQQQQQNHHQKQQQQGGYGGPPADPNRRPPNAAASIADAASSTAAAAAAAAGGAAGGRGGGPADGGTGARPTDNPFTKARAYSAIVRDAKYKPGPVPLSAEIASEWIYPISDDYPIRSYQLSISHSAVMQNTLVSLPTGLGKTLIAAVVMYNFYRWFPTGKVIFCAPTRPLVTQQIEACYRIMGIPTRHTAEISGKAKPESRAALWAGRRVFFCTPQTLQKDIAEGRCDARTVVCIVLDEAHKARGDYAYTKVVEQIEGAGARFRVVGLSATPGTSIKAIQEVVEALRISKVDARTDDDPNVKKYIHERKVEIIKVKQSGEITTIERLFNDLINPHLDWLRRNNAINRIRGGYATVTSFCMIQAQRDYVEKRNDHSLDGHFFALQQLIQIRNDLKISGIGVVKTKMMRLRNQSSGMMKSIVKGKEFNTLWEAVVKGTSGNTSQNADDLKLNNPKLQKLDEILVEHFERARACGESSRAIVFSQWRDSVHEIVDMLTDAKPLIRPRKFVGQGTGSGGNKQQSKESSSTNAPTLIGMKQSEQQEVIRQFREGKFNVIVCTCIGEEGLDIGEVDLIVNFDCLRSPIRMIQRTGRTGRKRAGRVVCLVAEGQEEQRLQSSTTATKMLGRALKDTNVFKFSKSAPMFPVPPALKKQNMAIQDDYRLSQVGGHSHKKKKNPASKNGPFIDIDKWRLKTSQDNERKERFGRLTGTEVYQETSKQSCVFPPTLRRKYIRSRMQARSSRRDSSSITSSILRDFEKLYLKQGSLQRLPSKAHLPSNTPSRNKVRPANAETSCCSLLQRDFSKRLPSIAKEAEDEERSIADRPPLDSDDGFPCDLSDGFGSFQASFPEVNDSAGEHDAALDEVFGSLQDLSIRNNWSKLSGDRIDSIFDSIHRGESAVPAPPRLVDASRGEYTMDEYCSMSSEQESVTSVGDEEAGGDFSSVPSPKEKSPRRSEQNEARVILPPSNMIETNEVIVPPAMNIKGFVEANNTSNGPEIHISIPTDSSSSESESDSTSESDMQAAEVGPSITSTVIDQKLDGAKQFGDAHNLPEGNEPNSAPVREARAPPAKESETNAFCPIPESVFLPINQDGFVADKEDAEEAANAFRIATQDSTSSSSSSSSEDSEANHEAERDEDVEVEERESPKSIMAANDSMEFPSQSQSDEPMPPPPSVDKMRVSTGAGKGTNARNEECPATMESVEVQQGAHADNDMTHCTEDTPVAFRAKPCNIRRNVLLSQDASREESATPSQAISTSLLDTPEKSTSPTQRKKTLAPKAILEGDHLEAAASNDDDIVCAVCACASSPDCDPIVLCDGPQNDGSCNVAVHKSCYSITVPLEGTDDWRCEPCEELYRARQPQQVARSTPTCNICNQAGGALRRTPKPESCWVHPVCMFWSPAYAHISLGKGRPVPDDGFCCKIRTMEELRLASFDWKLNTKCSFCSLCRAVKCSGAGCNVAAHPHCASQRDGSKNWSLIHNAGENAESSDFGYDVVSGRALWHMFCPAHIDEAAQAISTMYTLSDFRKDVCQKCVYFRSRGEDMTPCVTKPNRRNFNTETTSKVPTMRRRLRKGVSFSTEERVAGTSTRQDPRKRLREEGKEWEASQKENKASKREMLRKRVSAFFDTEAGIDPGEDAEGDAGEADEIRAIEEEEKSNDSFINDTSQLGYTQDALDLVDDNAELHDVAHRDANNALYREVDNERERMNQFATPVLNRRVKHKTAISTPLSAPSSQKGLGNMAFIRSVIEHHKAGGESEEIENEYHKIALESKLQSAASVETQASDERGNGCAQLQAATSSGLVEPSASVAPAGSSSGISPDTQNRASETTGPIVVGTNQSSSVEGVKRTTPCPRNEVVSVDHATAQLHTRAPPAPPPVVPNTILKGGGLTEEQKARIERNRQEALRRKQQRMQERMLSNNRSC